MINLDTSEAGQGRITCRIGSNVESDVDIDIVDNGDGTISVMYTPRKPGAYTLEIKFGGQTIPDGTFTQQVTLSVIGVGSLGRSDSCSGPRRRSTQYKFAVK